MRRRRVSSVLLVVFTALLVTSALFEGANLGLIHLQSISTTAPINYNPVGITESFKSAVAGTGFNPPITSSTLSGCGSPNSCTGGTSIFTPIGMADFTWQMNGPVNGPLYFNTKSPSDLSSNCDPGGSGPCSPTGTYGMTAGFSGSGLSPLTASCPSGSGTGSLDECKLENGNSPLPIAGTTNTPPVNIGGQTVLPIAPCYPASQIGGNCTPQQYSTMLPGSYCLPGSQTGTICNPYMIYNNYTAVTPYNATYNKVTSAYQAFYVGRYWFTVNLTTKGSAALSCVGGCAGNFLGSAAEFTPDFAQATAMLNKVSLLTNAKLGVVISIPATWVNTNLDFAGVYGAWYGINSNNVYTGTCTSTSCNTGLSDNSPIGIFKDAAMTMPAFTSFAALQPLNQYTSAQLLVNNITKTLNPQVTFQVSISSFGHTYSSALGTNCTPGGPVSGCWAGDDATSDSWSIPIIYDTMGSRSIFQTSYVQVNPVFGTASVSGKVLDGGSWLCLLNLCPGLSYATVSAVSGKSTITAADGSYTLGQLASGSQSVTVSAPGYQSATFTVNCPQTGACSGGPSVLVLQPLSGFGNICLIQPTYIGGGLCAPIWVVVGLGVIGILGLIAVIALTPLGQAGGRIAGSVASRIPARRKR